MLGEKNSTLLRSYVKDTKGKAILKRWLWSRDIKVGKSKQYLSSAFAGGDHTHHQEPVVAQRVAGYGGEVVLMAEDAAAIALPATLAAS